jgi:predicted Ser/Thr protein kinase
MKTFAKTHGLDSQFARFYRPLARNLVMIAIVTAVLATASLFYFDHRLTTSLSKRLIESNTQATAQTLQNLFDDAQDGLHLAQRQIQHHDIRPGHRDPLFSALAPFLSQFPFLDSINLADADGNEYVLIKRPGEILTRGIEAEAPNVALWQRRVHGVVVEQWTRQTDVSPVDRPWFKGAMSRESGHGFWTTPYTFLTTKQPGVSVSSRWSPLQREAEHVVSFNITLIDISHQTTQLRPSDNGMTVIFTQDGETLGLPPDPRFEDESALLSAVLSPVTELKVPALDAALAQWYATDQPQGISRYRTPDRAPWWAGFSPESLDEDTTVWVAVLIPEDDFLGATITQRNLTLAGIGLTGILIAGLVFVTSMRSIRRQVRTAVDRVERKLGQYRLRQKIGEGGNGAVYRATHALLRRPTAIKLMNPEFARSDSARKRFEHEVQITSNLNHPNTIAIYDYGRTPDGTLYYAMEFLNGGTLERLVQFAGALPPARVIHILEQIAGSLAEAHAKRLIHRDIKPSNAILCERGGLFDVVKVLDFGLVKEIAETDGNLTQSNLLIGTPLYMAPEIISSPGQASPQGDLYALGAVGYMLLTGSNVFDGESAVEICAKHLHDAPVPPSQRAPGAGIPADLEALILTCLSKEPADRPAGASEFRAGLMNCMAWGEWDQGQASAWWHMHSAAFTGTESSTNATPLSNTEVLVDLDRRALSTRASRV